MSERKFEDLLGRLRLADNALVSSNVEAVYELRTMYDYSTNEEKIAFLQYLENAKANTIEDLILEASQFDDPRHMYTLELYKRRDGVISEPSDVVCINANCRKQTVYMERIQGRSGDEGTTTYYRCKTCLKRWRGN